MGNAGLFKGAKITKETLNNIQGKLRHSIFNNFLETLNEEIDDIQQVQLRVLEPDATNRVEWFLKKDLDSYPRYAVSESTYSSMFTVF
jgi:hypothetical protein